LSGGTETESARRRASSRSSRVFSRRISITVGSIRVLPVGGVTTQGGQGKAWWLPRKVDHAVANKGKEDEAANYSFVLRGYVRHWLANVWSEFDRIKLTDLVGAKPGVRGGEK